MRKFMVFLLIILAALLLAGFIAGNYFFELAILPNTDKSAVYQASHNVLDARDEDEKREENAQRDAANDQWLQEKGMRDVYMQSRDDLRLHALQIMQPSDSNRWAIACHGWGGKARHMVGVAQHFYQQGFHVLVPDCRGHGESEGGYVGMGWPDRLDMVDWIQKIVAQNPEAEIALYGISMGGATVMMTAGEDLPANVKAIVEDCGYSSLWEEFSYQLKNIFGLPAFPLLHFSTVVTRLRADYWIQEGDTVKQLQKAKTPIFFIHGAEDTFVPAYMLDIVYNAANVPKQKLLVDGAGHGASSFVLGDAYWQKVWDFLFTYIK